MDDLILEFIEETNESLQLLDQELVRFEQDPSEKETLSNIFRVMHTIKGTCGFLGLPRLERVAHAGEDVLGMFRDGTLPVTPKAVSLILKCIDHIRTLLDGLSEGGEEGGNPEDDDVIVSELRAMVSGDVEPVDTPEAAAVLDVDAAADIAQEDIPAPDGFPVAAEFLEEIESVTGGAGVAYQAEDPPQSESAVEDAPAQANAAPAADAVPPAQVSAPAAEEGRKKERAASGAQSIRVNVDVLENLMTMVSEMVLTRNQLLQLTRDQGDTMFSKTAPD